MSERMRCDLWYSTGSEHEKLASICVTQTPLVGTIIHLPTLNTSNTAPWPIHMTGVFEVASPPEIVATPNVNPRTMKLWVKRIGSIKNPAEQGVPEVEWLHEWEEMPPMSPML